jgi:hypothetical protein
LALSFLWHGSKTQSRQSPVPIYRIPSQEPERASRMKGFAANNTDPGLCWSSTKSRLATIQTAAGMKKNRAAPLFMEHHAFVRAHTPIRLHHTSQGSLQFMRIYSTISSSSSSLGPESISGIASLSSSSPAAPSNPPSALCCATEPSTPTASILAAATP